MTFVWHGMADRACDDERGLHWTVVGKDCNRYSLFWTWRIQGHSEWLYYADSLGPILTATADDLSSSYGHGRNVHCALQDCNETMVENEQELEQVLVAAFPPPRTKHARRGYSPVAKTYVPESADDVESTDALQETTLELLQKHKKQVKLRPELTLLQIRDHWNNQKWLQLQYLDFSCHLLFVQFGYIIKCLWRCVYL